MILFLSASPFQGLKYLSLKGVQILGYQSQSWLRDDDLISGKAVARISRKSRLPSNLRTLVVSEVHNLLMDKPFLGLIMTHTSLKTLDMSCTEIDYDDFKALSHALENLTYLRMCGK